MKAAQDTSFSAFKRRAILVVAAAYALSIPAVVIAVKTLPGREGTVILKSTVERLEKSVNTQHTITDAIIQISKLTHTRGYELNTGSVIRDHRASMAALRKDLPALKRLDAQCSRSPIIAAVVTIMVLQGIFILFYLVRMFRGISGIS